ncbi:hypothetical protein P3T40_007452 [Paraburkholderia sp. EB58]|jgi:hypothetical protein
MTLVRVTQNQRFSNRARFSVHSNCHGELALLVSDYRYALWTQPSPRRVG